MANVAPITGAAAIDHETVTFTGGSALAAKLQDIAAKMDRAARLSVGFFEGATEADGTSVPMIAATQEFGSDKAGIPPRPFFRNMIGAHGKNWGDDIVKLIAAHGYDAHVVLNLMGQHIKGQLQQSIQDTNEPPLAAATIAKKGFDKTLIETSTMWKSIDYVVE